MTPLPRESSKEMASSPSAEEHEAVGVILCVGERGKVPSKLVGFTHFLPHGAHDVDHLPVGDPLAAGPFFLLSGCPCDCLFHA